MMQTRKLKHAGLTLYLKPGTLHWHLPVCGALEKGVLEKMSPSHPGNWEVVDFDGVPTLCYSLTNKLVRVLNNSKDFGSFYEQFKDALGEGPVKECFHDMWLRRHNEIARCRSTWERCHGIREPKNPYRSMSIRKAARLSI